MADIIQLLPDHVANQIAAGEVVQRPASVVKELLENAIDAQSEVVKLIVKDAGKTLIQVVDDGVGMSGTDARLSFERHATSKIRNAEDLFELQTKGFRGEALASIAAIAHVELQTRMMKDEVGNYLKIAGSKVLSQEVIASPKGTSIAVKNLFFNIPARRNFLKSNQVELRHIIDEFHRISLSHPNVQFIFYNNGSELFHLPSSNFRQRIVHIFGNKSNEKLVPVEEETEVVKISGFICKPEFARKSRKEQFFFVNKRFIKSSYLHHAVVAAFDGLIKQDTYPGYFLMLEVNPASIDINIHPTKTEIKFDDEHTLYALLRSTIKHSLGQFSVMPALDFEQNQNLETPYAFKDKMGVQPKVTVDADFNPFKADAPSARASATSNYIPKKPTGQWESMYVGLESKVGKSDDFSSVSFESDAITGDVFEQEPQEDHAGTTFQLRRKYIITTIRSGMMIIDQNRAHQRVLYEQFLRNITVKEATSQQLLFPLELDFSKMALTCVLEMQESLAHIGFVFEKIADEKLKITGLPALLPVNEVRTVLDELIASNLGDYEAGDFSQTDILAKSLCKSMAVKNGTVLDATSQLALVNDLFACKEWQLSPFRKPIYTTLTESDIDKKFL